MLEVRDIGRCSVSSGRIYLSKIFAAVDRSETGLQGLDSVGSFPGLRRGIMIEFEGLYCLVVRA